MTLMKLLGSHALEELAAPCALEQEKLKLSHQADQFLAVGAVNQFSLMMQHGYAPSREQIDAFRQAGEAVVALRNPRLKFPESLVDAWKKLDSLVATGLDIDEYNYTLFLTYIKNFQLFTRHSERNHLHVFMAKILDENAYTDEAMFSEHFIGNIRANKEKIFPLLTQHLVKSAKVADEDIKLYNKCVVANPDFIYEIIKTMDLQTYNQTLYSLQNQPVKTYTTGFIFRSTVTETPEKATELINFMLSSMGRIFPREQHNLLQRVKATYMEQTIKNAIVNHAKTIALESLPPSVISKLDTIKEYAAFLLSHKLSPQDSHDVQQVINETLPELMARYFSMADGYRLTMHNHEGKNALQLLEEALGNIDQGLRAVVQRVNEEQISSLSSNTKYTELKYVRN